uniref:(northern house mosquito) hypothetical protein n=1 Tax=Culex pipiens TaxID=7175 RepID=A0A8D8MCZ8_CULPI
MGILVHFQEFSIGEALIAIEALVERFLQPELDVVRPDQVDGPVSGGRFLQAGDLGQHLAQLFVPSAMARRCFVAGCFLLLRSITVLTNGCLQGWFQVLQGTQLELTAVLHSELLTAGYHPKSIAGRCTNLILTIFRRNSKKFTKLH